MSPFTQEDLKNLLVLISKAQITGQDAMTVAVLQQKLTKLLTPDEKKETEPRNEGRKVFPGRPERVNKEGSTD